MLKPLALALLFPSATAAQEVFFQSPSGNIHCAIFEGALPVARCDLREFTPSFARPADCELDWGYAFEVQAEGAAQPICAGDTVAVPDAPVLGYGKSRSLGGITCTSAQSGMTCSNGEGHGFTLSKARQRLF